MCQLNGVPEVNDLPVSVGILEQHPTHIITELKGTAVLHYDLHTQVVGPGAHHSNGLGVATRINQKNILVVLGLSVRI